MLAFVAKLPAKEASLLVVSTDVTFQGNEVGVATRSKPGQSGNPGGRPKGRSTIAHKVMTEAFAVGDVTKAETVVRKRFDLAMEGNLQAIKLLLDRESPANTTVEVTADVTLRAEMEQVATELRTMLGGR